MQTKIEKFGRGFGLVVQKELLDACGFETEGTVTLMGKTLVVTPQPREVRQGWEEAMRSISQGELDRDFVELGALRKTMRTWDDKKWQWPESDVDEMDNGSMTLMLGS